MRKFGIAVTRSHEYAGQIGIKTPRPEGGTEFTPLGRRVKARFVKPLGFRTWLNETPDGPPVRSYHYGYLLDVTSEDHSGQMEFWASNNACGLLLVGRKPGEKLILETELREPRDDQGRVKFSWFTLKVNGETAAPGDGQKLVDLFRSHEVFA